MNSISSDTLNLIVSTGSSDPIDPIDLTLLWIRWFSKRGHKYLILFLHSHLNFFIYQVNDRSYIIK